MHLAKSLQNFVSLTMHMFIIHAGATLFNTVRNTVIVVCPLFPFLYESDAISVTILVWFGLFFFLNFQKLAIFKCFTNYILQSHGNFRVFFFNFMIFLQISYYFFKQVGLSTSQFFLTSEPFNFSLINCCIFNLYH